MLQRHSARATRALQKLAEQDPAFAGLALWCTHLDSDVQDGPAWTDGKAIYYGPTYEGLSLPEQMGLAAHHILHIAFRHAPRSRAMFVRFGNRFDQDIFNLATDAIVNETLLLSGHILPRPLVRLTGLLKATTREEMKGEEAVTKYDAERLYILLMQDGGARQGAKGGRAAIAAAAPRARVAAAAAKAANAPGPAAHWPRPPAPMPTAKGSAPISTQGPRTTTARGARKTRSGASV
ncbi:hypothetical protein RGUI_1947 [Rhodovulum sp. P5]|uniref:DUF2201 family putative metallopeptidase n=1 Tax=Rhodovulum sp. P5 TaxID=1564506 RepID=UPI0009C2B7DD|nr:hypothetical protein RGUI_1947 [Rhodovulum sp. P5]